MIRSSYKTKTAIQIIALFMIALLAACCSITDPVDSNNQDAEASSTFLYRFSSNGTKLFFVHGINGNIQITGVTEGDSIEVAGDRIVRSDDLADAQEHLQLLTVETQKSDTGITVHTRQPNRSEGRTYQVEYHIRLPKNIPVGVELTNGNISIDGLSSAALVLSVNGNVNFRNHHGGCAVGLVNGQIDCDVTLAKRDTCSLNTVNGNITLTIPGTTSARLQAGVTNGSVSVLDLEVNNLQTTRTSVSGVLGSGEGKIELNSVNGNIVVKKQ